MTAELRGGGRDKKSLHQRYPAEKSISSDHITVADKIVYTRFNGVFFFVIYFFVLLLLFNNLVWYKRTDDIRARYVVLIIYYVLYTTQ